MAREMRISIALDMGIKLGLYRGIVFIGWAHPRVDDVHRQIEKQRP